MAALLYGGFDITEYFYVRIDRPTGATLRVSTESVPGRDGDLFQEATREPVTFVAHCLLKRKYLDEWYEIRDLIAAALWADGKPQVLSLPDDEGWEWVATASMDSDFTSPVEYPVTFDITFTCHDPVRRATRGHKVQVPSAGSVTFAVGGMLPCELSISAASAVRDGTTHLWGIRFDNGPYLRVELPTSAATAVSIDCPSREVRVGGALSMVTLDSLWPTLAPGRHTASMDQGAGAATLAIVERGF